MKIEIFGISDQTSRKKFRIFARSVLSKLYSKKISRDKRIINIIIVSDGYIKKLNRQFLGQNCPTDVLAFPINDREVWSEIYISRDRAKVQAKELNIKLSKEICNLTEHGILHLFGYSHGEMKNFSRRSPRLLR